MQTKQIGMRMPFDLVQWLEAQAEKEHRSFSSQINYLVAKAKDAQEKQEEDRHE